jgi:hypothetical protein
MRAVDQLGHPAMDVRLGGSTRWSDWRARRPRTIRRSSSDAPADEDAEPAVVAKTDAPPRGGASETPEDPAEGDRERTNGE